VSFRKHNYRETKSTACKDRARENEQERRRERERERERKGQERGERETQKRANRVAVSGAIIIFKEGEERVKTSLREQSAPHLGILARRSPAFAPPEAQTRQAVLVSERARASAREVIKIFIVAFA